ncbi:hypothetical protein KVT40_009172 [Elsinoe batatas]|uniref:FAD/NAD(P)-binding domain-containing protein n=1 Tax=Elsinoe batatas TaxID=2601811 RepID=A0A8K0PC60_9PEZI|nr:hypothetical protein KVT40_009172 [Elsinoe batatas]
MMGLPVTDARTYDVIVVGGGPAGLQTALGLARHLWRILVIDSGSYRNDATSHMHNVPGWDHAKPSDFRKSVRDQILERYDTVNFIEGKWVTKIEKNAEGLFTAALDDGTNVCGRKVVLATGIKDVAPPIPGYDELWGKSILHCLFCHGYEERGVESAGVLATDGLGNEMLPTWVARYAQRLAARITIHANGSAFIHVYNTMPDPVTVEVYIPAARRGAPNQSIAHFNVPQPPTPVPGEDTPSGGTRDFFFPLRVAVGTVLLYNVRVNYQQNCG